MKKKEEMIQRVDEQDTILGLKPRSEFHTGACIYRSVGLMLFNNLGELLMCQRDENKVWSPGLYSYSVSGTVGDESPDQAMYRETQEELGICISSQYMCKFYHDKAGINRAWKYIYTGIYTGDDMLQNNESSESIWKSIPWLLSDISTYPEKYTTGFCKGLHMYIERTK